MNFRLALAAATCLALPIAAHAQPVVGPYVNLMGGTSIQYPLKFDGNIGGAGFSGKFLFRPAYAGIGGVGYGVGMGVRVELDGDYIYNTAVKADFDDFGGSAKLSGHAAKYGAMLNALYDLPLGLPIYPYLGAGVGYQFVNGKYSLADGVVASSGTKGSFAFDVIAGASYPIAAVPGLSIVAQYTFLDLTEAYKYGLSVTGGFPAGSPTPGTLKIDDASHVFTAGIRYALFPAPEAAPPSVAPPVAPPTVPVVARTYLVFFDWDKYNLTPRADQIIAEAASDSKTAATTTIDVSGYTDTSGTPVYNQGLSERRAKAVAAQLVSDGVPMSEIAIHAYGETHLLVPTGPGVREPQNRRVEIVLQ